VTIASEAFAAVPSFSAHTATHPPAESDGDSGSLFAKQLSGLTDGLPDAGGWRSAEPAKLRNYTSPSSWASPPPSEDSSEPQSNTKEAPALPILAEKTAEDASSQVDGKAMAPVVAANPVTQVNVPPSTEVSGNYDLTNTTPQIASPEFTAVAGNTDDAAPVVDRKQSAAAPIGKAAERTAKPQKKADDAVPSATATTTADAPTVIQPNPTFGLWSFGEPQKDSEAAAIVQPAPVKAPATNNEPVKPATPTVTAAAGSPQNAGELAFATRVQPVQNTSQSALPAEMAAAAAVASASKKLAVATEIATASPADIHALPADAVTIADRNGPPSAAAATAGSNPAATPEPLAESLPKAATPLKDISLQVSQPGADPVAVRVVQEGSQVHVTVHSGDAALTSGLRQGLSELQSRLEENGYRSEMWKPTPAVAPPTPPSTAQDSNNRGGDQPSHQGGSQQESGRRNQNQSNQPRWVEELEASTASGEKTSGGFYGFSS